MSRNFLLGLLLFLSFLGVADSWYLAETAARGEELACGIGEENGCQVVAESPYSRMVGIPISVYGVLFYALVLVVVSAALTLRFARAPLILLILTSVGAGASVIFLAIQALLIKAMCAYCIASACISFGLLVVAWLLFRGQSEEVEPRGAHS